METNLNSKKSTQFHFEPNSLTRYGVGLLFALLLSACDKPETTSSTPTSGTPTTLAPTAPTSSPAPVATPESTAPEMPNTAPSITPTPEKAPEPEISAPMAEEPKTVQAEPTPTPAEDPLAIARTSGCLACHSVKKKVVGPAWRDVAKRYANDSGAKAKLIEKVKKGGTGNWKEVTGGASMPPYSPRVSDQNIEMLIDFIMALPE